MYEFRVKDYDINISIVNKKDNMPLFVLNSYEREIEKIKNLVSDKSLVLVEVSGINWNSDMTPWKYNEFSGNADNYLNILIGEIMPKVNKYLKENSVNIINYSLIGYSLAGLFSLYVSTKNTMFNYFASVSGSLWYKGFKEYFKKYKFNNKRFYISLGDKESDTKNKTLKTVKDNTLEIVKYLEDNVYFEFNNGGHFKDEIIRISKAIDYLTVEQIFNYNK